jgi:hypothetical protein
MFGLSIVGLLIVRFAVEFILNTDGAYLPIAEPFYAHIMVIFTLGVLGAISSLFIRHWRAIIYGAFVPMLVYLGWAVVQQNLIINPDIWKLWERGWLAIALAVGTSGLGFSILARLIFRQPYRGRINGC